jgi:phage tail sheath gpL-like
MPVVFNYTPSVERVPLTSFELNAGTPPYSGISRTLLTGHMLSGGTATVGVPLILGGSDPNTLFGAGSQLAETAVYARWHNPIGAIYVLPVAPPSGAAATITLTFAGTATAAGNFSRYIGGQKYTCAVAAADTAATVATNFLAAVNQGYRLFTKAMLAPCTGACGSGETAGVLTLTYRHLGPTGNMLRVDVNLDGNDIDPAGITCTLGGTASGSGALFSGGTGTVSLAAALADIPPAMAFDWVIGPFNTTQNFADSATFFANSGSGRWAPTVGLGGHYITFYDGNLAAQTSLGAGLNDMHCSILGGNQYPHAPWAWLGALAGVIGQSKNLGAPLALAQEIGRPLQTLQLQGLRAPANPACKWAKSDRQALYTSGIGAVTFGADGTPQIDRIVTTYQVNAWGAPDTTFLDIETLAICRYVIEYIDNTVKTTYPRHILRPDNPRGLQGVATPPQIKATMIHAYNDLSNIAGIVDNADLFAQYLDVEIDTDTNRVDSYLPINPVGQLRVFAANVTVFQQLSTNVGSGLNA